MRPTIAEIVQVNHAVTRVLKMLGDWHLPGAYHLVAGNKAGHCAITNRNKEALAGNSR